MKAVFKNGFRNHAGTLRLRHERHVLGLHVGGETRVLLGGHITRAQLVSRLDGKCVAAVRAFFGIANHLHAHLIQLGEDGSEVLRVAAFHREFAARDRRRRQERSRFDAVRNNAVLGAVQPADAVDGDPVGPRALDTRAHLVEQIREVLHFQQYDG